MTYSQSPKAGVVGWPVSHSLSPRLHRYWLKHYSIDGYYELFPVEPENLSSFLKSLPTSGLRGINLTVPHKELAFKMVDEVEPLATRVGAVNTIVVGSDGKLLGRNTDVFGFSQNLAAAGLKPDGRPAVLLGAGGAARAALVGLIDMGLTDIRILNRTRQRAETLAKEFASPDIKITPFEWGSQALDGAGLLANGTSLGLNGQPELDLALDHLPKDAWVTDMVYAPLETDLLKRAAKRGNRTVDGLGMLLHQARPAFAAFYGIDPTVSADLRDYVLSYA